MIFLESLGMGIRLNLPTWSRKKIFLSDKERMCRSLDLMN
nr:MAG TPA: hypothetical protein [Bacteriophage sp.]